MTAGEPLYALDMPPPATIAASSKMPGFARELVLWPSSPGSLRALFGAALLLLLAGPGAAVLVDGSAPVVELGLHAAVLEDPKQRFSIDDLETDPIAGHFTPSAQEVPNFGLSDSAWWLRIDLENPTDADLDFVLESWWAVTDLIELYVLDGAGSFSVHRSGESVPHERWEIPHRTPAFSIALPAGEAQRLYVRSLGDDTMLIPLRLFTPAAFQTKRAEENLVIGAFLGIFLILVAYNLVLFSTLRDPTYLYYSLWVAFMALHQAAQFGLLNQYLWPDKPALALRSLHVMGAGLSITLMAFTRSYLATSTTLPRLDPWMRGLQGVYVALLLVALFGSAGWFVLLMSPSAVIGAVLLVVAGALAWRQGASHAGYYLAGFALILLSAVALGARGVGLLPSNLVVDHAFQLSFVLTVLSLSLGLSDRLKRTSAETESERRRAQELEELKRQAEHSNLAKSRVLATASHDVRQPLHALGLFAQQLRSEVREPRARATLERLDRSLNALGQMLARLFDMSKIESGNVEPDVEVFELGALLERVADEFEETARGKGLRLVIEPSTVTVKSDLTLLGRILQNFIANAIQYTDSGEVRVKTQRCAASLRIEVHDSGVGIPEEKQSAVFEEFVRLDASRGEGLGLGLSIVSGLAKLLDHEVGIEASPLGGSAFYVSVPIAISAEETPDSMLPLANLGLDGHFVAVIDDDLAALEGMRGLIESWGCEVLVAQDSEDLLAGLESRGRAPEMLLADYRLANGATGVQAIERVRELWGSDLAALVITGETSRETEDELRRNGLIHLTKPVPPHKLRAVLLELMRDAA